MSRSLLGLPNETQKHMVAGLEQVGVSQTTFSGTTSLLATCIFSTLIPGLITFYLTFMYFDKCFK